MSAIAGVLGDAWVTVSPSVSLGGSPETFNDQGDHIHYFAATHQFWDPTYVVTVQYSPNGSSGWTNDTSGDYTFYYPLGMIVFNTARGVGTNNYIRVSVGYYFTATQLDGAHSWKMSLKGAVKDVTPFQATGSWAVKLGTIQSASGSIMAYRQDNRLLTELNNTSGTLIGLQLWHQETNGVRWQCFGQMTGLQQAINVQDVDQQTINFTVSGQLLLITSNTLTSANIIMP